VLVDGNESINCSSAHDAAIASRASIAFEATQRDHEHFHEHVHASGETATFAGRSTLSPIFQPV
jgi:hypothetical protein